MKPQALQLFLQARGRPTVLPAPHAYTESTCGAGFDAPGTICQTNCSFTICAVPGFDAQCEVPVEGDPDIGDAPTICRACGQPGEKCCNGDEPGSPLFSLHPVGVFRF